MDSEEILELVDQSDMVIGRIRRGDISTLVPGDGKYVRSADIFIIRPDGAIWVPVRSMKKSIAPGGLDYSVGGHVPTGETYELAAQRELKEEANIIANAEDLELVAIIPPEQCYFSHLYLLRTRQQPQLSDEHTDGSWMPPQELHDKLTSGVRAKESLLPNLKRLQAYLSNT